MQIKIDHGSIQESKADTIIVNLFEEVKDPGGATGAVDKALDGAIKGLITSGELSGKKGEVGLVHPRGAIPAERVLVVGLGKAEELDLETVRSAAASAIQGRLDFR